MLITHLHLPFATPKNVDSVSLYFNLARVLFEEFDATAAVYTPFRGINKQRKCSTHCIFIKRLTNARVAVF